MIIEDLEEIREPFPEEYQILHAQSITSLAAALYGTGWHIIGYLGVDNPSPARLQNISPLLQTLCYFLMLARNHAEKQTAADSI